jgi:hypothetical protein
MAKRRKRVSHGFNLRESPGRACASIRFHKRIIASLLVALGRIVTALAIGIVGYHIIAGLGWIDSLLEASMILGGMGPVHELRDDASKVFASIYALFSGVFFIALMGIMLSPVAHRVMHKFHVDEKDVE